MWADLGKVPGSSEPSPSVPRVPSMIRRYQRRPTTAEAVQWTGDNYDEIRDWSWDGKSNLVALLDDEPGTLMVYISVEDQWVKVRHGWWIVRGISGEFYPCEHEVFIRSWEEAEASA